MVSVEDSVAEGTCAEGQHGDGRWQPRLGIVLLLAHLLQQAGSTFEELHP